MNIYDELGVEPIINAVGPATRLSGSIMHPEVAEAMRQASECCVDIAQMQARAGEIIAEITGAEAGYVTSGAAAGLLLGTAACVTGLDPGKMNRLPDTSGMKNEVIMARSHRNFYDHAVRSVGIELVEVGIADRFSGAGIRDAEGWEIEAAISERTAAIVYVAYAHTQPSLEEVVAAARKGGVPVIVDAAGQLPPASNLQRFIAAGADLVAFSGGKAIGGPQASGILCGRRDLIAAGRAATPRPRCDARAVGAASEFDRQVAATRCSAAWHWASLQGRQGGDRGVGEGVASFCGRRPGGAAAALVCADGGTGRRMWSAATRRDRGGSRPQARRDSDGTAGAQRGSRGHDGTGTGQGATGRLAADCR